MLSGLKSLKFRQILLQGLNLVTTITSTLVLWKGLGVLLNNESPIVVVLSESMSPGFERGDILVLRNPVSERYANGDIVVYKIPGKPIPIVHRILETHDSLESANPLHNSALPRQRLLTKGDHNHIDDLELYDGLDWLEKEHVVGKVFGYLPYIGYISILLNESTTFKYAIFGAIGLFTLVQGG